MSKKFGAMILCSAAAVATAFFTQQKNLPTEQQNKVSPQAVYMIVNLEGCVRNPYKCPADVWTNGVGNTHNVDKSKLIYAKTSKRLKTVLMPIFTAER